MTLPKAIFNLPVKSHELIKLAYDSYLANSRSAHAKTKKRGEVRGGGIAFGPTGQENFHKTISRSAKLQAVREALSLANHAKKITTIPDFTAKTAKTAKTKAAYQALKLDSDHYYLLVVPEKTPEILRATNNIPNLKVVRPTYLTVFDIMNADQIIISEKSLPAIEAWLLGSNNHFSKSEFTSDLKNKLNKGPEGKNVFSLRSAGERT